MKKLIIILLSFTISIFSLVSCSAFKVRNSTPSSSSSQRVFVLSEFGKLLQKEGRIMSEIRGFMQLENENDYLDAPIGVIKYRNKHYTYFVNNRDYDGQQTANACGIWAVRRKLRHIASKNIPGINSDAWWRLTDAQIREILGTHMLNGHLMSLAENIPDNQQNGIISTEAIVNLQLYFGLQPEDCTVIAPNEISSLNPKGVSYFPSLIHPNIQNDPALEKVGVIEVPIQ
ncbi:MAG: hypothetical protein LBD61_05500 [Endomicrobium sp.]|jgi:hypothetical protein|nr:hypothetical protein [Endomicrobium sp.]